MDEGERARRLVQKLKAHQDSGEFAQMIALKDEATQLSAALAHITEPWHPESQDDRSVATILHESLAGAYEHMGMFAESIDLHTRRLQEAQRHGDVRGEMCALKWLGASHRFLRQDEQALAFLERLLALLESNRAQHIRSRRFADEMCAMSQLGECYFNLGRGKEALKMQKKQLQRAEKKGTVADRILALNSLAMAQSRLDPCLRYETLCKAADLIERSVREGQPNTHYSSEYNLFKQTFYRLGIVCSNLLQTSHFALYSLSKKAGVLPAHFALEQPSAPGGKKDQVFEALHAFRRAIELHDQDKFPSATASFKQDALLFSARLLYMQGNEDEAVQVLEASLELTVDMARVICAGCHQVRGQVSMLESTCGKCGVARYCSKEHQKLAWNVQVADQKASGVTQFLSHKFLCSALKTFKSVAKGKHQSEECRTEILGLLRTMAHWKPPNGLATTGKLAERVLVAGATVKLVSLKSTPELNGRQGKLVQYMGARAEFLNSSGLDCSAEKWQVQLDPVASGLPGSSFDELDSKTIVAKTSNLVYVSGPAGAEDKNWWTSPLEDEEAAKMQSTVDIGTWAKDSRPREGGSERERRESGNDPILASHRDPVARGTCRTLEELVVQETLQQRRGEGEGGGARFPSGEGGGADDSCITGAGLGGVAGLVGLSKEDAEHVILVRGAGELQVGDVVKMHSLQTEAFNGLFGTLTQWLGDKERWAVQLQKTPGKVITIRADNLMFVRERKAKPLPGNNEITQTLVTMTGLCNRQDWQGILDMEETALLAARALVLPTSRHQGRAEAVYYWLGLANERLAQQLSLRGVDVREHHHTKRALELYQQQLTVAQEHGGRAEEAKAHGNLGNAHILKGGYARASELIQRALDMFQSLGDTASAAVAVQTLTQLQLAQALRLPISVLGI